MYEEGRKLSAHQPVSSHLETLQFQADQLNRFKTSLAELRGNVEELVNNHSSSSQVTATVRIRNFHSKFKHDNF